ncbi:MAG TPA: DUF624 domain-containing protein [Candidatus Blautia stercoravium]|nr:DUF624 domain-containing protein [Candidatus Blautia stercoravium]
MFGEIFNIEKILNVCDKILYFLKINLLFLGSNLSVLLFFLFVGISQVRTCLPLFLLCMVPAGPALSAVFFSMNRMLRGLDCGAWKDYKTGYLDCWGRKAGAAAIQMLLLWIFWTNVEFFSIEISILPLTILFVLLFAAVIIMTPSLYLLASRYEMKIKDLFRGALTLCITRPVITLGNTAMLAVILMLLEIKAGTVVLFMASIYGFAVVFMNQGVLRAIEESH